MYLTTTGTCVAILTRLGRQVAAENSVNFKITQYRLSDDEIDYSLFDGTANADQHDILNTPILEACTLGGLASQKYYLESFTKETNQVAYIDTDINYPFVDGQQNNRSKRDRITVLVDTNSISSTTYSLKVRTFYGADSNYIVQSQQPQILQPVNSNYASVACSDSFETRQNQTEVIVQLILSLNKETLVTVNSDLLKSLSPKTIQILEVITGKTERKEMRLSTGQLIKHGDAATWNLIGAASCVIHIAGVTTQKGCDVEFLFYNGLTLSQREAVVVQEPVTASATSSTVITTTEQPIPTVETIPTAPTITENTTVSTVSYVNGVAGNWIENPEWISLNKKIQDIQTQKTGFNAIFGNSMLFIYQSMLKTTNRYIFVPLNK